MELARAQVTPNACLQAATKCSPKCCRCCSMRCTLLCTIRDHAARLLGSEAHAPPAVAHCRLLKRGAQEELFVVQSSRDLDAAQAGAAIGDARADAHRARYELSDNALDSLSCLVDEMRESCVWRPEALKIAACSAEPANKGPRAFHKHARSLHLYCSNAPARQAHVLLSPTPA